MKIDAFPHVMPRQCYDRFLAVTKDAGAREFLQSLAARAPLTALWDLDARFRMMDEQGDYVQVLTLCTPPIEVVAQGQLGIDLARMVNDGMAELVSRYPDRFKGFAASLPLDDADASLAEIDRTVNQLGALGIQIFTNVNGLPWDEPRFEPLFAKMAAIDKPIWVHGWRNPTVPDYAGESHSRYGLWLGLGWPYEMAMFVARVSIGGVLARHPNLRILTHHSGGMTPMFARRMGAGWQQFQADREGAVVNALAKPAVEYAAMFYADTTGQSPIAIRAAIDFFGIGHMLMGTDYPWFGMDGILAALGQLGLSADQLGQILEGNAQAVLGVKV